VVDNRPKGCVRCFKVKAVSIFEFNDLTGEPFICYFCEECQKAFTKEYELADATGKINMLQSMAGKIKYNMSLNNYKPQGVTIIK
jgi:hypothetical protein